ncbi:uncharacterized protein I206_100685 [Kwoniella pini CBS 10737]|uniref:GTPase-activating protein GYP5 n=1 Tax=Kwoniella pini CBS 10737 TaxID=1296096 RepID=A0A1B9ICH6_9TREE|nr:uncharacterized protein I206_00640 [Kwoniella pini CBS 10737]OCF53338.1 hypothetical protein I206_00640 [Kwoniella pini CBS 10737]
MSSSSPFSTPSSTSSSRLPDPTSPQIHAAQELELDNHSSIPEDVITPSASTFNVSHSPSKPSQTNMNENEITPVKGKSKGRSTGNASKVKAAAALFENKTSPSSSNFRSIPPNDKSTGPVTRLTPSPSNRSPSFNSISRSLSSSPTKSPSFASSTSPSLKKTQTVLKSPDLILEIPFIKNESNVPSPINILSPIPANTEKFSEVSLLNDTPQEDIATTPTVSRYTHSVSPNQNATSSISTSRSPSIAESSRSQMKEVYTPPAKETPVGKTSFFSSTLNFGFPSSSASSSTSPNNVNIVSEPQAEHPADSQQPSRSGSSSSQAGGWKSTMTSFLSSRSTSTNSQTGVTESTTAEPDAQQTPKRPTGMERQPSAETSFILNRVDSSTASRDRRISSQLGGGQAIREGFERVRGEMECAAREMRRERESKALTESEHGDDQLEEEENGEETVDWNFWGSVVQDFESVARERPKELSKAIQMGIPPVIRGAIWQLMSSSKSTPLEETYKALLKIPSTHEKAIKKDLSRTFPHHKYFQDNAGMGQEGLFMVVKAYSLYDPEVGYTQGLAFIVAALLLNMPDEEAFCVLVRLMDSYNLRSHFTAEMRGLQLRLFQFDRLVEEILPLLHTHLVRQGVKSSIYAAQWFMTLFSYRFPLSLVYRVLDIVFAEGIEAIFRFSLALLKKSENQLLELEFEQILNFLQSDLFEVYRISENEIEKPDAKTGGGDEEEWKANDFVRDAYEIRITPFMLDSYASEWEEQQKNQNRHALEVDTLRNANRNLSSQVKQLEASLATINQEHVELVRQLVMSKIEKEEIENELVRYKMLYAELAHAQQDALSTHSRLSGGSIHSQMTGDKPSS